MLQKSFKAKARDRLIFLRKKKILSYDDVYVSGKSFASHFFCWCAAQAKIKRNIKKLFSLAARPSLALFRRATEMGLFIIIVKSPYLFNNQFEKTICCVKLGLAANEKVL